MQCLSQGDVASIGQRCDDQPFGAAKELVHVGEIHVGDRDLDLVLFFDEIESRLFEPIEIRHRANVRLYEFVENVLLMHVDRDERFVLGSFDTAEIFGRLINEQVEQVAEDLRRVPHDVSIGLGIAKCFGGIACPNQLYAEKAHLSRKRVEKVDQVERRRIGERMVRLTNHRVQRTLRFSQKGHEPHFDVAFCFDWFFELGE